MIVCSDKENKGNYFIHSSGENCTLAVLEIEGALEALGIEGTITNIQPQLTYIRTSATPEKMSKVPERMGLGYGIYQNISTTGLTRDINETADLERKDIINRMVEILGGERGGKVGEMVKGEQVKIVVHRIQGGFPWIRSMDIKKALGIIVYKNGGRIDLRDNTKSLVVMLGRNFSIGQKIMVVNRNSIRNRHNKNLPFVKPVTLSPIFAKVLTNMARIRKGDKVLDPFCGTGSVLCEAGLMGADIFGTDIDREMIQGAERNIKYLGLSPRALKVADVGTISTIMPQMDAVITDPPYGRSTTTRGEELGELMGRSFVSAGEILKKKGRLALILPTLTFLEKVPPEFTIKYTVAQRVHRSLVRHFVLLIKK